MFKRLDENHHGTVTVVIEGESHEAAAGETVAAALLACGYRYTRKTPVSGARRAPFCLMGICYECLVVINDQPNQRACQVLVHEGMTINRQLGTGPAPK